MSEIPHPNITRLVVKNYRSLKDIDVRLQPLTVLVGENGSGKSNLIDVLRFVRDALVSGFQQAVEMRGGMNALRCWFGDQSTPLSIHLEFEGAEWAGEYAFAFDNRHAEVELLAERLSLTTNDAAQQIFFEVYDGVVTQASAPVTGKASNKSLYLSSPPVLARQRIEGGLASHWSALQAVHDFLAKMNFYELSPSSLRQPQPPRPPFPLSETGDNLASTLLELQRRQKDYLIMRNLNALIEELVGYEVEQVNGHLVTKLHYTYPAPSRLVKSGPPKMASSLLRDEANGTIRMLALLATLYQNRSASPLAIEEPAKEMYSRELGLTSAVIKNAEWRSQIIITTHSRDLIDGLPAESFLVLEKDADAGVSRIGPLSCEQQETAANKIFSLGELMQIEGLYREGASWRAKV